jgi:5-methylcytosine-specific restriction endonuclease McrA
VKNGAKTERRINPASGRMAQFYLCSSCKGEFLNHEVEVDHILPVVDPAVGFIDWDTFISRLFSPEENYQLLCQGCHKTKTNAEKKLKKERKANENS